MPLPFRATVKSTAEPCRERKVTCVKTPSGTGFSTPKPEMLGRSSYEKSFNITFLPEHEIDGGRTYDFTTRVVPVSWQYGLRDELKDKSVAVMGNGVVRDCGIEIDAHDEVVRISSMRNWSRQPAHDGARVTLWSGQLAFVVSGAAVDERFREVATCGTPLWTLSPFHITCDAYSFLRKMERQPETLVLPSGACLFDMFHRYMTAEDMETIFSIAPARRQLTGMTRYELLLTGTRLALALEACGVGRLSLYGFDLFSASSDPLWFGHDLAIDRQVLLGVRRRFEETGRLFHWHNEPLMQ